MIAPNIFDELNTAQKAIEQKSYDFVNMYMECIGDIHEDSVPSFMNSSYGYSTVVSNFMDSKWIANPNYKPGLSSEEYNLPENRAVEAGFSQINILTPMVNILITENQDTWDDWEPETENLNNIPLEIFLNPEKDKVLELVKEREGEELERLKEREHLEKWGPLYNIPIDDLEKYVKLTREKLQPFETVLEYREFEKIIGMMK